MRNHCSLLDFFFCLWVKAHIKSRSSRALVSRLGYCHGLFPPGQAEHNTTVRHIATHASSTLRRHNVCRVGRVASSASLVAALPLSEPDKCFSQHPALQR